MLRFIGALAIAGVIGTSLPASAADLELMINSTADQNRVPRHIAHGVIRIESGYNCRNRNRLTGASGIMQVLPATAHSLGVRGNLLDCETGLAAGMRYLRAALDRGGDGCAGVSLYQSGIFVRKLKCTAYGRKVLRAASVHHQGD
jgi:soluble lytic murein transglycosylase-like protein